MPRERRTIAKSFRVDEEALEALREEARSQNTSLNTLVNQLIVNYASFWRYMNRVHGMVLSRQDVNELISYLSEDAIVKAGQNTGRTTPEEGITARYGKITVGTVIELIHTLSSNANWFEYTERTEGEHLTITLMHEMGRKWSLFISEHFTAAFAAAGCQAKRDIADRYVTFTI